jgi:hypothetical protein
VLLVLAASIGEDIQTFYNFKVFREFFKCLQRQYIGANWLQHQKLAQYKENQNVCSTTPNWLNVAYSVSLSKRKWK